MRYFYLIFVMFTALCFTKPAHALSCAVPNPDDYDLVYLAHILEKEKLSEESHHGSAFKTEQYRIKTRAKAIFKGAFQDRQIVHYKMNSMWGPFLEVGQDIWLYARKDAESGHYTIGLCDYGVAPKG